MKIFLFILIFFFFSFLNASDSDFIIQGKVRHINTHEEISDVNIYVKDFPIGTTSDNNGRFKLVIPAKRNDFIIVFDHIAYDTMQVSLEEAISQSDFYLKPNLLQTNKIIVEAKKARSEFAKDLPQSLTIITAKEFEGKGYIDVGDLLRVDQSIVIEEDLSGKKTISMRGGNAEDVVVFYNGVKMNNNYDNVFDLSLINIEDIEQIEVIKGSNTALFGSDAFSGVINIIPKLKQNYTARFIQKFGSYNSGDWNFQANHDIFKNLHVSYNQKRSGSRRPYDEEDSYLENSTTHHSANMVYNLSKEGSKNISAMYMRSKLDYFNSNIFSRIDDLNQLGSISYAGNIGNFDRFKISLSYQNLNTRRSFILDKQFYDRHYYNDNYFFNLEKTFFSGSHSFLTAYQYENGKLDYKEESTFVRTLEAAQLSREKHGVVGVLKLPVATGSEYLNYADINLSYRYDYVKNQQRDMLFRTSLTETNFYPGLFKENSWQESTLKISIQLKGRSSQAAYTFFMGVGNNAKFPTMFHQLSMPSLLNPLRPEVVPDLNPEKNYGTDLGFELMLETPKQKKIEGFQLNLNYFKNIYKNKFRSFLTPATGIAVFDNVPDADITGIEAKIRPIFLQGKLSLEAGATRLFVSEKAAFPFKSETKYTIQLFFDYSGFSTKVYWFNESSQVGWVRSSNGGFGEIEFPGFTNMDFHLSKKLEIYKLNYTLSFSIRNIINDQHILEGIALRDRRFYIGLGVEY
ncbi:MAG: hypothetical protein D8M58_14365 [Calditrichaeota bacterium]|nr:MAG: hypothetical protein DWQ03_15605 [Calditrichota bacterium]MBL1206585.1 hypothetical protein [Calditrichota bacterium]NOG46412.1 TonB-dependent receptor plug domain-containing protein [Calditrichota bacterium]